MNAEQAKKLRAPFPPEQIGKLPKPTKKDNPKGKCDFCGGWHGLPAVHLDYVGHAAVTDRLLQVDPAWSWEPMAVGPNGEPLMTNGGLWIKLTVCGVTRPGFGDEGNGKGMKEIIGDAIRNAAMRFGIALDLWAKEDLRGSDGDESRAGGSSRTKERALPAARSAPSGRSGGEPKAATEADSSPQSTQAVSQAVESEPGSPPEKTFTEQFQDAKARKEGVSTPAQQKQIGDLIVRLAELRGKSVTEVHDSLVANEGRALEGLTGPEAEVLVGKLERWEKNLRKEKAA